MPLQPSLAAQALAASAAYRPLEALPRELWLPVLVCSAGDGTARLAQLEAWRQALLAGELPSMAADFGDPQALAPLRAALGELALPELARGAPAVAEQVLRTALWHLDRLVDRPAWQPRSEAIETMLASFREEWRVQRADWDEVLALLQGLGELAALRWDALRGRLARREWREAQQLAAILVGQPALAALIASLGRGLPRELPPEPTPAAPGNETVRAQLIETRLPEAPGDVRGVRPGRSIARMLPGEAAQLRHPLLHKLWRARYAESRLLIWDEEAVLNDLRPGGPQHLRAAEDAAAPPTERGPMILCIDTSGSMRGAPERLAKAIVLEAARTAHREKRACRLLAFGGPEELLHHDLAFTPGGLDALLDFIGLTFDGGTDLAAPLARAIESVQGERWRQADLLIVSDGEFGCPQSVLLKLDDARQRLGLRVQGVLVGDRETIGLLEVCDAIHWVRDWRRHAPPEAGLPADGYSPVHSKSLTALYFPNALSERAKRAGQR